MVGQAWIRLSRLKRQRKESRVRRSYRLHPMLLYQLLLIAAALAFLSTSWFPGSWSAIEDHFRLVPATAPSQSLFGLAEYLTALALLFVVLTVSDFRYRYRLQVTRLNLIKTSFYVAFGIGFIILAIDAWVSNGWLVPAILNSANNIKLLLALLFLSMTCYMSYVAFVSPPRFSRWNSRKAFDAMHHYVARGNPEQLFVVADWLGASAERIISLAANRTPRSASLGGESALDHSDYAAYALLLLGDQKLCRQMVEKSPWTIAEFFRTAGQHPHANLPMSQFARNIGTELVVNPLSALYFEDDGFESGFLGFTKPISTSVYGDWQLVEDLASSGGSPLDIDVDTSFNLLITHHSQPF